VTAAAGVTGGAPAVRSPGRLAGPRLKQLFGLGSVFDKTLRDSRAALLGMATLLGVWVAVGGQTMMTTYGTEAARAELAAMSTSLPPILRGLYGNPVRVDTLGGFLSWHYGAYFAMLVGLWSILALSSTLAGEARRGSLDLVAITPLSRRRIAFEKVVAHIVALALVAVVLSVSALAAGAGLARFEGDRIDPAAAAAFGVGVLLQGLVAGAVAFALAPVLGQGAAAGMAGTIMLGGYVLHSYRTVVPAFDAIEELTWFSWAAGHIPLAGLWDWPAVLLTAAVSLALLAAGVEAFARRDIGVTVRLPLPALSAAYPGTGGPLSRTLADLLPRALAWGVGIGGYGLFMAASAGVVADAFAASPEIAAAVRAYLPGIDIARPAGLLQFAFVDLGFVLIGLTAASLVAIRAGDEMAGRLELQLTTRLSRARWAIASAVAVDCAIGIATLILGAGISAGVLTLGENPTQPAVGTVVLALYGSAMTGLGVAVAGLAGPRWAVPTVLTVTVLTSLVDLFAPVLRLPEWIEGLALTDHLGRPMIGAWDVAGMGAAFALAVAGILVGAWGMTRRDIGR
jgi:ABC-2 type transport system permease protein